MIYKGELVKHTLEDPVVSLKLLNFICILEVYLTEQQHCLEEDHAGLLVGLNFVP